MSQFEKYIEGSGMRLAVDDDGVERYLVRNPDNPSRIGSRALALLMIEESPRDYDLTSSDSYLIPQF